VDARIYVDLFWDFNSVVLLVVSEVLVGAYRCKVCVRVFMGVSVHVHVYEYLCLYYMICKKKNKIGETNLSYRISFCYDFGSFLLQIWIICLDFIEKMTIDLSRTNRCLLNSKQNRYVLEDMGNSICHHTCV
jgi:hypothetical protein